MLLGRLFGAYYLKILWERLFFLKILLPPSRKIPLGLGLCWPK